MTPGTNRRITRRKLAQGAMSLPIAGSLTLSAPASLPVVARQEPGANIPMYRGNAARTGVMPGPGPGGTSGVEPLWTNTLDGEIVTDSSPAIVDGLLYIGGWDGNVHALDTVTGESRWQTSIGESISSSPAVVDGVVYIGSDDTNVYALDAGTGEKRWSFTTGGRVLSSPATVDGGVFIGGTIEDANEANVYAIDAETGEERWRFATGGLLWPSSPAIVDGVLFIGSQDGNVYAIDAGTGEERWRFVTESAVISPPAVVDGVVCIGGFDGNVYAMDAATGEERWRFTDESSAFLFPPAVADGVVYIGNGNVQRMTGDAIFALTSDTGEERWRFSLALENNKAFVGPPTLADGILYFGYHGGLGAEDHGVYALRAETGDVQWQLPTVGYTLSSIAIVGGVAYVGSTNGVTAYAGGAPRMEPGAMARTIRETSLRGGPSPSAVERAALPEGTRVTLEDESEETGGGTWWPVSVVEGGREGWVIADDLEPVSPGE